MDTGSTGNICRVCRAEGSEDNPLFYPCKCAGSIRYVHEDCLKEWLKVSKRSKCELCQYPIQFRPVYSPAMPKRLPVYVLVKGIGKRVLSALRAAVHTFLVVFVWLMIIPNLCAHCFRPLFQQEEPFTAAKRFVLFGTSPTFAFDVFLGYMIMSGTIVLLFSLVYLRDEIINNNWNPAWLIIPPQHNNNNNNNNHHHHHQAAAGAAAGVAADAGAAAVAPAVNQQQHAVQANFAQIMQELHENHRQLQQQEQQQAAAAPSDRTEAGGSALPLSDPNEPGNGSASPSTASVVDFRDLQGDLNVSHHGAAPESHENSNDEAGGRNNGPPQPPVDDVDQVQHPINTVNNANDADFAAPILAAEIPPHIIAAEVAGAAAAVPAEEPAVDAAQQHVNNVLNMNDDAAMQHILGLDGTFNFIEYSFWFAIICVVFLTFCVFGPWKVGSVVLSVVADNFLSVTSSILSASSSSAAASSAIVMSTSSRLFGFNTTQWATETIPNHLLFLQQKVRLNENNMNHVLKVFSGYIVYAFGFRVLYDLMDPNHGWIVRLRRAVRSLLSSRRRRNLNSLRQQHARIQTQLAQAELMLEQAGADTPAVAQVDSLRQDVAQIHAEFARIQADVALEQEAGVPAAVHAADPVLAPGIEPAPAPPQPRSSDFQFFIGIGHVVVKLGILFFVEAAIHPAVFGYLMDLCSLELFNAKLSARLKSFEEAPLTSMFFHWLAGIVFISYFVWLMLVAREELRPGVLWFVRNYNEVNPLQQLAQWPVAKSLKNLSFVLVRGFFIVMVCFYLPTKLLLWLLPQSFPFRVDQPDQEFFGELFLEFCLLHYVGPTLFNQVNMKKLFSSFVRLWASAVGRLLGLTGYLLGEPQTVAAAAVGGAPAEAGENAAAAPAPGNGPEAAIPLLGDNEDDSSDSDDDDHHAHHPHDIPVPPENPVAAAAANNNNNNAGGILGGGGGNLGDEHDAVEFLLLTPSRPAQPYTKPTYFTLRIIGLLILLVITMSLGMCCIMAIPTLTGRFLLSLWMGNDVVNVYSKTNLTSAAVSLTNIAAEETSAAAATPPVARVHDLYAVITGICFIGLLFKLSSIAQYLFVHRLAALRAAAAAPAADGGVAAPAPGIGAVITTIIPRRQAVGKFLWHSVKVAAAILLLFGWLPFLVGLAIELTLHTPFTVVVMEQTPVLRRLRSYCFGLLLSKITVTGVVLLAPEDNVWRQRFEVIAHNGIKNLHFGFIWRNVVWPATRLLLTYLLIPYTAVKLLLWLGRPRSALSIGVLNLNSTAVVAADSATTILTADYFARAARRLSCAHMYTFVLTTLSYAVVKVYRVAIVLHNEIRRETYLVKTQLLNLEQQQRAAMAAAAAAAAAADVGGTSNGAEAAVAPNQQQAVAEDAGAM